LGCSPCNYRLTPHCNGPGPVTKPINTTPHPWLGVWVRVPTWYQIRFRFRSCQLQPPGASPSPAAAGAPLRRRPAPQPPASPPPPSLPRRRSSLLPTSSRPRPPSPACTTRRIRARPARASRRRPSFPRARLPQARAPTQLRAFSLCSHRTAHLRRLLQPPVPRAACLLPRQRRQIRPGSLLPLLPRPASSRLSSPAGRAPACAPSSPLGHRRQQPSAARRRALCPWRASPRTRTPPAWRTRP
jgi:hypothetical protein